MRTAARHRLALIAFCAVMWLPGLPIRTLWPTDEPRYALIARDMVESGDYVVPMKRGQVYHSQPPLYLWLEALSSHLTGGMTEAAARLPSFLAALGCALVVHSMAASLFGPAAGLMSALVLATDIRFLLSAQWAATDMLLCLFTTSTLAAFYHAYCSSRRGWYYVMYAMAGLGALTKGPVGFVLPGAIIVCFLAVRRDLREVLKMRLPSGVAIVAAVLAPWLVLFWRQAGTDEVTNLVFKQSFQRYTDAWNNLAPWYYFLWRFPLDLLPWTPVFPLAAAASARRMDKGHRVFLWTWFAIIFLFFSASTGKRGVYILPLHPAAAMLIGWFWGQRELFRKGLRRATLVIAALFAALGAALISPLPARAGLPGAARPACLALGAAALACAAAVALVPSRWSLQTVAAGTALMSVAGILLLAPVENRRQNIAAFSTEIAALVPEGAPLGMVRDRYEDLVYYSHREASFELRPGRRLTEWFGRPGKIYAVLDREAYDDLQSRAGLSWKLLREQKLAGEDFYLIVKE